MKKNKCILFSFSLATLFFISKHAYSQTIDTAWKQDSLQVKKDSLDLQKKLKPIYEERQPVADRYYMQQRKFAMASKDSSVTDTKLDSMRAYLALIHDSLAIYSDKIKPIALTFIAEHPSSYLSAKYLASFVSVLPLDSLYFYYNMWTPSVKHSIYGQRIKVTIDQLESSSLGKEAPNFSTIDMNGKKLQLSDFKGKYVLLDFWASWCVPCRHGSPHMIALYEQFHPKGLEVIGIASDDSKPDAWRKAIIKDNVGTWHNVLQGLDKSKPLQNGINSKFSVMSLPTKILINPTGKIIGKFTGDEDSRLDQKLKNVFGH